MAKKSSAANVLRFTIKPVGTSRTEDQVRNDVQAALQEAIKDYTSHYKKPIHAEVAPEGAFTGVELAALWLLKTLAGGAVGAAGGALYKRFAASLRKRNLDPGPPKVVKPEAPKSPKKPKARGKKTR
jgi:hypothetical protein